MCNPRKSGLDVIFFRPSKKSVTNPQPTVLFQRQQFFGDIKLVPKLVPDGKGTEFSFPTKYCRISMSIKIGQLNMSAKQNQSIQKFSTHKFNVFHFYV